jgi:hypothetical protein
MRAVRRLAFALCLALLSCPGGDAELRGIDGMVTDLRLRQDSLSARIVAVSGGFPYPEGTELIARSDSSGPRKLEVTAFGNMGKSSEAFYFKGDSLIYCERRQWRKDASSGTAAIEEARGYYFKDNRLFGAIDLLTRKRRSASVQLANEGPSIIERAYTLLRMAQEE